MGGEGPIYYTAISQYARDHNISGSDLTMFHTFLNAVDAEYLQLVTERDKARSSDTGEASGKKQNG
ncbi:hypothetical protein FB480_101837 [Agrobacterium vitis]|nr:hypothetical protein FB480_101837 [Agrobacterium vitis]